MKLHSLVKKCRLLHMVIPQREALIYRVKVAREFLIKLEITP